MKEDEIEIVRRLVEELGRGRMVTTLGGLEAYTLISVIQLAHGHPALSPTQRHMIETIGRELQTAISERAPYAAETLEAGWKREPAPAPSPRCRYFGIMTPGEEVPELFFASREWLIMALGAIPRENRGQVRIVRLEATFGAIEPEALFPRAGEVWIALSSTGEELGAVNVTETDPAGDAAGPWWSGVVTATGEELTRLRLCHAGRRLA